MPTGFMHDPFFKEHDTGYGHPETPLKYDAVLNAFREAGLMHALTPIASRDATLDELLLCHTREYLEIAQRDIKSGRTDLTTGDTAVGPKSWEVALRAAGGVLNAVDAVFSGAVNNAYCFVRPPGHHATSNRGMGFCIFNNVAIAARYAQKKHGVQRVLIADWDVHHGNGTQDIFYEDESVFFFSTHQHPHYPGTGMRNETGRGIGLGTTLNCPLPAGSGRTEIFDAFENELLPAMQRFKPELVLISAGFDSRIDDPLGDFKLSDADFADLTRMMMALADKYASGRLVSALEGGYNLDGLGKASVAHARALLGR
jgi:acetoin utilization deacetylase AcuC-like enzyme